MHKFCERGRILWGMIMIVCTRLSPWKSDLRVCLLLIGPVWLSMSSSTKANINFCFKRAISFFFEKAPFVILSFIDKLTHQLATHCNLDLDLDFLVNVREPLWSSPIWKGGWVVRRSFKQINFLRALLYLLFELLVTWAIKLLDKS